MSFKKLSKSKYEFFTHCQACDERLNFSYTSTGFCGDCLRVIRRSQDPEKIAEDNYYAEYEMWRNPMGQPEDEIFSDKFFDEEDYD